MMGNDDKATDSLAEGLLEADRSTNSMRHTFFLLSTIYLIFFMQYGSIAIIAPFFPTSEAGLLVGETMVGVVIAAYPLGTVLATPLPPLMMRLFGGSLSISLGLAMNAASSLAFGVTPRLLGTDSPAVLGASLVIIRLIGGAGSAVAEAGSFTVLSTGVLTFTNTSTSLCLYI